MKPILVSTLHSPNSEMLPYIIKTIKEQLDTFSSINIVVSDASNKKTVDYLNKNVNVVLIKNQHPGISGYRKLALTEGLKKNPKGKYFIYMDYDRLLHWFYYHPEEFKEFVNNFPKQYAFLSVGRTKKAFKSHPKIQQDTENWTNKMLKEILGQKLDTPSGCCVINKKLAEIITKFAKEDNHLVTTDGEWPALSVKNKLPIGLIKVNGLEFETPDVHREEIKKAGSLKRWIEDNYDNEKTIKYRWKIAKETIEVAKKVLID